MSEEMIRKTIPRIMFAAPSSGSGKTTIVCGILKCLLMSHMLPESYKCGPDYIDPMFHRTVLSVPTFNLDSFFTDEEMLKYLFCQKERRNHSISVVEGVMGYYDGMRADSYEASTYDIARKLEIPVILIVNAKGASLSIVAMVKGFLEYQKPSYIQGIILNQISENIYFSIKECLERELDIPVLGYVPTQREFVLKSRHLGLIMPNEIEGIREQIEKLAIMIGKTIDIKGIIDIAKKAESISYHIPDAVKKILLENRIEKKIRMAYAYDHAFCFYYQENFELLEKMGVTLVPFSPLYDKNLPENICGIWIGGGYPELYLETLSKNIDMREALYTALEQGMPCIAECGGFLYLQETMENEARESFRMVGFLKGHGRKAEKRNHFGYVTVKFEQESIFGKQKLEIPAHEFHYWESDQEGKCAIAWKPDGKRHWNCERSRENVIAGFPHFSFCGNIEALRNFVKVMEKYRADKGMI